MTVAKSRVAVIAVLLATVCGGPWGCAVKGHLSPSALSDEVRAQLNTVGVSTAPLPPEAGLDAPRSGKAWGALKGAGSGLAVGAVPGLAIASGVSGAAEAGPSPWPAARSSLPDWAWPRPAGPSGRSSARSTGL